MERIPKTRLQKYRADFQTFNALNAFSFMLLSGTIPILFAMNLGASGTYIGILGSLNFITFFLMPIGRRIIRGRSMIKVFGWSWLLRYWGMIPAVGAPVAVALGVPFWGLALLLAGSLLFNVFRGIGMVSNNPLMAFLGGTETRGAFLSNVQIVYSITSIITSAGTAYVLHLSSGNLAFVFLLVTGIVSGTIASIILLRLPDPEAYRPAEGSSLTQSLKEAWTDTSFRHFVYVFAPLSFTAGTARTFLLTHARALYDQNSGMVVLFSVFFNIGVVAMGYLLRKLMDRLGPKPLYTVFSIISVLAMIPIAASPGFIKPLPVMLFLGSINFLAGFAIAGQENAGQAYFFSIVKPEHMVDLAIIYFIIFGLGGALGSASGGLLLDALATTGVSTVMSYRILYLALLGITLLATIGTRSLSAPDSASVRESIGVMFSIRDLKAIGLLERLVHSGTAADDVRIIRQVGSYGSAVSERELLPYVASPRFEVRVEALLAIESLNRLSPKALRLLSAEMDRTHYSTAYLCARIIGKFLWREALPSLRTAIDTDDYMLQGAAMTALARLGDESSVPEIEALAEATGNPRALMSASSALEAFGKVSSVPVLVGILKRSNPPPFVYDEIVLAIAGILGGLGGFYRLYSSWTRDPQEAMDDLFDIMPPGTHAGTNETDFRLSLGNFVLECRDGVVVARAIAERAALEPGISIVLSEAALDEELANHGGFRFFLAACAAGLPINSVPDHHKRQRIRED
jgi:HEAT repeat protein